MATITLTISTKRINFLKDRFNTDADGLKAMLDQHIENVIKAEIDKVKSEKTLDEQIDQIVI